MSYAVYEELTEDFVDEREEYDKWMNEKMEKEKELKEKQEKEKKERQEKHQKAYYKELLDAKEKFGDYWEYQDILIPLEIRGIKSIDGYNAVSWWFINDKIKIMETAVFVSSYKWNSDSYKKQFAELKEDGKWYWKN